MWAAYTLGVHGKGPTTRAVKRMLQHAAREIRTSGAQAGGLLLLWIAGRSTRNVIRGLRTSPHHQRSMVSCPVAKALPPYGLAAGRGVGVGWVVGNPGPRQALDRQRFTSSQGLFGLWLL